MSMQSSKRPALLFDSGPLADKEIGAASDALRRSLEEEEDGGAPTR